MQKGKILVVDDEVYILHILEFSLGAEGFEVITANNGELAVEKAVHEKPDLIVLDIMMPVLDGYETCRRLKRDSETKHIPVILLTAKGRESDKRLGFEVGAIDYIVKPFSPNRLISRIEEIIGCRK
ncbi:MAG: response regulator [Candidatus Latescibacterota bacterium]|nr:MAG: response regulator [Candidatus Latescibacterota bacterium]